MNIRKCNDNDLNSVFEIEKNCFKNPYKFEDLKYELENVFSNFYVIEETNEILGFIIFLITFNSATICQIAIKPNNRRQGLGQKLINHMEEILSKQSEVVESCTLEVRESNLAAINFYKKNNFKEILLKKNYYENGENALYMVKYYL